jgi:hypothetical protein
MGKIKYWTNCGVCNANIPNSQAKVIGATMYCQEHHDQLIRAGFDKLLGNPLDALAKLGVRK